jgi:ABC-type polysaccharide/polyol phosphate transport system ATPase subunit
MKEIAVSIHDVSKKFRLFNSPQERLFEALHPFNKKYHKEFWALRDISFEIEKGETIGIIGRNGSGKSTLLQIICSILEPTSGEITVNGKISALLELGAGFNPEFTGRQNVFMKGMLMGFSSEDMKERMPEIEAFAEIGEFIDQPVKIYSSGMFVRLAFATAINVDPDILIVDEALAVGDAKFQQKCYQKFLDFQKAGKTTILVTHDNSAVVRHCDSAVLLEKGRAIEQGLPKDIVNYYLELLLSGKISGYKSSPCLEEEGYRGFNIVQYEKTYYAVLRSLGKIDFTNLTPGRLNDLVAEKKCVLAGSLEEVKQAVGRIVSEQKTTREVDATNEMTELDKFFQNHSERDNCPARRSYNKNEHRFGNKRAEIIDYLVVCGAKYDPLTVISGDTIYLYAKVRFNDKVELPMIGFSLKTIDGVTVYGSNTRFSKQVIAPVCAFQIVVFKFSIKLSLIPGDSFIEIGVAEKLTMEDESFDIRKNLIHLKIDERNIFEGLAELGSSYEEVLRVQSDLKFKEA